MRKFNSFFPIVGWLRQYNRALLADDLLAGAITAVLLVPQGLAYATLAGLPPQVGLYASIIPPIVYAVFGTSRTLSVGPVSVAALLVATALAGSDPQYYVADALLLALLSGGILLLMAALRLDVLVNFISHPALSGFTSGAAVLIIFSQFGNLFGIALPSTGSGYEMLSVAWSNLSAFHLLTATLGVAGIILILLSRQPLIRVLNQLGMRENRAALVARAGPLCVVALLTAIVAAFDLHRQGVEIVGNIQAGVPLPDWHFIRVERAIELLPSAAIISLIGYVESVSVAKVLAYRCRQKLDNNQELLALGVANLAASFSGGMPVAGGFSRSTVNFSAGAKTQLASVFTAVLVALVVLFLTPLFYYLPKAALAAIIVVAVSSLLDWQGFITSYRYDKADAFTALATFAGVLVLDIDTGLLLGVAVAIGIFLWRSSRPHVAIVGRVPRTHHFRNVARHNVETWRHLLLLRIDRSLFFANVSYIEDLISKHAAEEPKLKHLVLICSAVNNIDYSALESLQQLAENLRRAGITLHMAEVKGPVMDRLERCRFKEWLAPGEVFMSTENAVERLREDEDQAELQMNYWTI